MAEAILHSYAESNPLDRHSELGVSGLGSDILELYELEEDIACVDNLTIGEGIPFSGPMQTADELPEREGLINPTCSEQTWTVDNLDPDGGLWDTGDVEED